ncbi:MAG: hypothetical protein JWP45_2284 [Mucilaginibacter sp.]|nr:hypothetical protein [Mucilaginibacter sp.]
MSLRGGTTKQSHAIQSGPVQHAIATPPPGDRNDNGDDKVIGNYNLLSDFRSF